MSVGLADLSTTIKALLDSEERVRVVYREGDELRSVAGSFKRVNWQIMFEPTDAENTTDLKTDTIDSIYDDEGDLLQRRPITPTNMEGYLYQSTEAPVEIDTDSEEERGD